MASMLWGLSTAGFSQMTSAAVTVEELLFSKKSSVGEETVHDPDTVEAVVSRLQGISCILDRPQMTGSDVAAYPYESKIL